MSSQGRFEVQDLKRLTSARLSTTPSWGGQHGGISLSVEELKTQTRLREREGPITESSSRAITSAAAIEGPRVTPGELLGGKTPEFCQGYLGASEIMIAKSGTPGIEQNKVSRLHFHPYLGLTHFHFHSVPHHHGGAIGDLTLKELYEAITDAE